MNNIVDDLKNGKIGIVPTETVLGLICKYDDKESIERIYRLKNRPVEKKLTIIFENIKQIEENYDIDIPYAFKKLALFYWPGPLTIIIEDRSGKKIGFRKPNDERLLYILSKLDFPLIATSVNKSGKKPAEKIEDVSSDFINNVDFIINIDSGMQPPSTVFDLVEMKVLRKGKITETMIKDVLNKTI